MKITKTILIFLFLFYKSINGFSQWSTDSNINNPICIFSNDQISSKIISDGNGGAIIVWIDKRNGVSNKDIYAQRIDSNGLIQWTSEGIPICTAINDQDSVDIISDGNGGVIIAWNDYRNSTFFDNDIYAQKINSAGVPQWTNNGLAICTAANSNYNPRMVSDGNGGAIITWMDNRVDTNEGDVYAQSINSFGIVQWVTDGIPICDNTSQNDWPQIASDGSNGAIITWQDTRNGNFDLYAQRINSLGVIQWTTNGIPICTAADSQAYPNIISNDIGGAIITWSDGRNSATSSGYDIYAQCVNSSGIIQWTTNGVNICNSLNGQDSPILVSDGNNGAIISWIDYRTSANSADIYAQRINLAGIVQWMPNGVGVSTTNNRQWLSNIISDGIGGAIITWQDERLGVSSFDIYAQRINSNGIIQWTTNGAQVSTASNNQASPFITSDENNGAIIAWSDYRSGTNFDIYAQKINSFGTLSTPIELLQNESFLNVFPNPSKGIVTFKSIGNISEICLIDNFGEIVFKKKSINFNSIKLDLSNLSNGVYFYKAITDNNIILYGKLIIAH